MFINAVFFKNNMSLSTFETENAQYYLGLGLHDTPSASLFKDVDLSGLDFFVFEINHITEYPSNIQYNDLQDRLVSENILSYAVDVNPSMLITRASIALEGALVAAMGLYGYGSFKKMRDKTTLSRRRFLRGLGGTTASVLCASYPLQMVNAVMEDEGIPGANGLNSLRTSVLPLPHAAFREAVAARKIEEYLVPKHKKEGKVKVGVVYGATHSGIETHLKYPWLRDIVLGLYQQIGYGTKWELNEIRRFEERGSERRITIEDCGLF